MEGTPEAFSFSYMGWKCGVRPAFLYTSPHATFQVMRKYLDTVSVVWERILLRPPSLGGRLTDRKSEEQQADELWAVQSISSWLARSIILTGRSHNTTTCTPPTPSLLPMNLSLGPISLALYPFLLSLAFLQQYISLGKAYVQISLCQSDGNVLKEAKATLKPLHLASCTGQAMDTEQRWRGVIHCSSE